MSNIKDYNNMSTATIRDYNLDTNKDILTDEDMLRIAECKCNLDVLNRKLGNVIAHIDVFRAQIEALYDANSFLLDSPDSRKMMNMEVWKMKFNHLTAKRATFDMANRDYIRKLEPLQKQLSEKMANVKEKAKLRDKEPNYNNPIINDIKVNISVLEKSISETNRLTDHETTFLWRCSTYQEYRNEFWRLIGHNEAAIKKKLAVASTHASKLENAILEDTWVGKYLVYARLHDLDADSDALFDACNRHYLESHANGHIFDCTCDAYIDTDEDEIGIQYGYDYGCGHIWSGGRCSHGTKMYIEYDARLPIGLIENSYPLSFCHLAKH